VELLIVGAAAMGEQVIMTVGHVLIEIAEVGTHVLGRKRILTGGRKRGWRRMRTSIGLHETNCRGQRRGKQTECETVHGVCYEAGNSIARSGWRSQFHRLLPRACGPISRLSPRHRQMPEAGAPRLRSKTRLRY